MKPNTLLSVLSFTAAVAAAPGTPAVTLRYTGTAQVPEIVRIMVEDLPLIKNGSKLLDGLEKRDVNNGATLQAWSFSSDCLPHGQFNFLWHPVSYGRGWDPESTACYEYHDQNGLRDTYGLLVTGNWPGLCAIWMYERPGCAGSHRSGAMNACGSLGGKSIKSFRPFCA